MIEKIPDGKTINGYGERTDGDGNIWVYVKYNNKSGWVMKELLSALNKRRTNNGQLQGTDSSQDSHKER